MQEEDKLQLLNVNLNKIQNIAKCIDIKKNAIVYEKHNNNNNNNIYILRINILEIVPRDNCIKFEIPKNLIAIPPQELLMRLLCNDLDVNSIKVYNWYGRYVVMPLHKMLNSSISMCGKDLTNPLALLGNLITPCINKRKWYFKDDLIGSRKLNLFIKISLIDMIEMLKNCPDPEICLSPTTFNIKTPEEFVVVVNNMINKSDIFRFIFSFIKYIPSNIINPLAVYKLQDDIKVVNQQCFNITKLNNVNRKRKVDGKIIDKNQGSIDFNNINTLNENHFRLPANINIGNSVHDSGMKITNDNKEKLQDMHHIPCVNIDKKKHRGIQSMTFVTNDNNEKLQDVHCIPCVNIDKEKGKDVYLMTHIKNNDEKLQDTLPVTCIDNEKQRNINIVAKVNGDYEKEKEGEEKKGKKLQNSFIKNKLLEYYNINKSILVDKDWKDIRNDEMLSTTIINLYILYMIFSNSLTKTHFLWPHDIYNLNEFSDYSVSISHLDNNGIEIIFFPICSHEHYFLVVFDLIYKYIYILNSQKKYYKKEEKYIKAFIKNKKMKILPDNNWKFKKIVKFPQQSNNSVDCGVFILIYVQQFLKKRKNGDEIVFSFQSHYNIKQQREKISTELQQFLLNEEF